MPSRRTALAIGAVGVGSIAVGVAGWNALGRPPFGADDAPGGDAGGVGGPWIEPRVLESTGGVLDLELRVAEADVAIAGTTARMLTYNGTVPGPTLHVRPGDRLRPRLINGLDVPTNLHTHGLLVSPGDNGDNPFLEIGPGEAFDYEIPVPRDHPSGVFWYHPHLHGLVADQVFGGLYGAIVVDAEDWSAGAPHVAVVSDVTLSGGSVVAPSRMERMAGRLGEAVLVNGRIAPRLVAAPGDAQRLLVVNACVTRYLDLDLAGREFAVRGFDSGAFAPPLAQDRVLIPPGGRADLDVAMPDAVTDLVARAYDIGGTAMGMMRGGAEPRDATLLTLVPDFVAPGPAVHASPTPASSPRDLRSAAVAGTRTLTLSASMGGGGMQFLIDGVEFDAGRTDQAGVFGTVEEWTLRNQTGMDHPIHLHVWPMQVVRVAGADVDRTDVRDVVDVPAGQEVTVRIAFDRHAGRTVYHCHILDHEDRGMMGVVEVR